MQRPPSKEQRRQRIIVKIGTSSLITTMPNGATGIALTHLASLVEMCAKLRYSGYDVVIVSSGAIGAGCHSIGLTERPSSVVERQALASIGQVVIMQQYSQLFSSLGISCSQVLLTYENFVDRTQFVNAKNTMSTLFDYGVVPVVNENDTVGIHELKADNDKLACMVGNMIGADMLFLMTDVNGVFTANPHKDPNAKRVDIVTDLTELRQKCSLGDAGDTTWGTGGMAAKISAAALAMTLGVNCLIMNADDSHKIPDILGELLDCDSPSVPFGTLFLKKVGIPRERKRWIKSLHRRGTLVIDNGAVQAVRNHKSLFAAGITEVLGCFGVLESVVIQDINGNAIGSGLVNFTHEEVSRIKGMSTSAIAAKVGQAGAVIDRDNLVLEVAEPK